VDRAPAAAKAGAMLYEVHSLIEFVGGILVLDVSLGFIDLDEGARPDNRVHRPVLRTDEGIAMTPQIERI
jgi:hypothetical protein